MEKIKLTNDERIRLAELAETNGWTYVDIGSGAGTTSDNAWKIIHRPGIKRSRFLPLLDAWLYAFAHIPKDETSLDRGGTPVRNRRRESDETVLEEDSQPDSHTIYWWDGLPEKLIGSAKDLRSPLLDEKEKLNRFLGFMTELNKNLNGYINALERFGKR